MNVHDQLQQSQIVTVPHKPNRPMHNVSFVDTFGINTGFKVRADGTPLLDAEGKPVRKDRAIQAFVDPGPLTPEVDPNYRFPPEELLEFLKALEHRDTTILIGHSGTGKTELVNQVAARLNYNVVQINFDGHLTRGDLVGDWKIVAKEMVFRYGLVPLAFTEPGTIVLFDEVDACAPETAFVLQRAVSKDLRFLMHETSQVFSLHPQNMIAATANTNGMGDESNLYTAGTNVQNFSFMNRWKTCIAVDYIKSETETEVLRSLFTTDYVQDYIPGVVKVLNAAREAFKHGTLSMPLTTRDGINWMEKITRQPLPLRAARYSFLDKLPMADALGLAQIISRNFQLPDNDDKKYLVGKS